MRNELRRRDAQRSKVGFESGVTDTIHLLGVDYVDNLGLECWQV